MAIAIDQTNAAPLLKIHYSKKYVETLAFKKSPTLALLGKDTNAGGVTVNYPIISDDVGGRSADMSIAIANAGTIGIQGQQVAEPLIEDFGAFTIKGMTIKACNGDMNSFMKAITFAADSAFRKLGRQMSVDFFRQGWGVIGQIKNPGGISGSTITLQRPEDAVNFNRGDTHMLAPSATADARNAGVTITVSGVDYKTGIITYTTGIVATIAAALVGDVIINQGDRQVTGVTTRRKIAGLPAWIPSVAPAAANDLFPAWDRRTSSAFYGFINDVSTTGGDILNTIIETEGQVNRLGGEVDLIVCNDSRFLDLKKILQQQKMYEGGTVTSASGALSFKSINLNGVDIVKDKFCDVNDVWFLQRDTWEVISLGDSPQILDLDGSQFLRQAGADGYEGRVGYYANLKCHAPGWNGRAILPARV